MFAHCVDETATSTGDCMGTSGLTTCSESARARACVPVSPAFPVPSVSPCVSGESSAIHSSSRVRHRADLVCTSPTGVVLALDVS
eukprot:5583488-Amphidinium_carterae.1